MPDTHTKKSSSKTARNWLIGAAVLAVIAFVAAPLMVIASNTANDPGPVNNTHVSTPTSDTEDEGVSQAELDAPGVSEEEYLFRMRRINALRVGSDEQLLEMGEHVCEVFGNGYSGDKIVWKVYKTFDPIKFHQANMFVGIAAATYCPKYLS